MGIIFVLIYEIWNQTNRWVGFEVSSDGYCPIPDLPPAKTRMVKQSKILKRMREHGSDWKIRVLVDNRFTGIELDPLIVLDCTRVLFRYGDGSDSDVLVVEGIQENCSDYWLRLKYFGCMRNIFWDGRKRFPIARSNSRVAAKLRDIDAYGQNLAPLPDKSSSIHTPSASPIKHEEQRKRDSPGLYATVDPKINDHIIYKPPPPSRPASPPPPLSPSPPPQMRSRERYSVAEDSDEDFWRDIAAGDSSSDTSTDHVSPRSRDVRNVRHRVEANTPAGWREIGGSGGAGQSARREHMDGFEHAFFFLVAFTFSLLLSKLFA